jgi:ankyrin repeat protein
MRFCCHACLTASRYVGDRRRTVDLHSDPADNIPTQLYPSRTMSEPAPQKVKEVFLPRDLIPFAHQLISAVRTESLAGVKALLAEGAPAWYQDEELGWSSLHYAAEKRNPQLLKTLIQGGAVWNAVDKWGQTAGEICLSLGDQDGWEMIRNEGIRTGGSACFRAD